MEGKCTYCNIEFEYGYSSKGKFCSSACAGDYRSLEHKVKFFAGKLERIERATARKYLAEVRGYKCEVCGIKEWNGNGIVLEVDHVNGDPSNDHPSNLRLICPNCHSQTEFLGAANKGRGRKAQGLKLY